MNNIIARLASQEALIAIWRILFVVSSPHPEFEEHHFVTRSESECGYLHLAGSPIYASSRTKWYS